MEEKEVSFRDESAKNTLVYQNYQRSVHLLKTLKEKLDKKEAEVHEKMNENHRLKVRAAAAWEEFTPRPSFKPVPQSSILKYLFLLVYWAFNVRRGRVQE